MDHFKDYNDTYGHAAGDVMLRDLVTAIRAELRTGDVIARWGGDEFALALPGCDLEQAQTISSRLLRLVPGGQTVSIGLTQALAQDTPAGSDRASRHGPLHSKGWRPQPGQDLRGPTGAGPGPR